MAPQAPDTQRRSVILLPPRPIPEPWYVRADKQVRRRGQYLNDIFSHWVRMPTSSKYHQAILKLIMQGLKKARSEFSKHSRAIKEYLIKEATALYDERLDGRPCEFLSSADQMLELSKYCGLFDENRAEAYLALSEIERNRQSEEDRLEKMQEVYEEAEWQIAQDRAKFWRQFQITALHTWSDEDYFCEGGLGEQTFNNDDLLRRCWEIRAIREFTSWEIREQVRERAIERARRVTRGA